MLPLSLLRTAQGEQVLVELKNGHTYNGKLQSCDNWMNIILVDAVCTSRDGEKFWNITECYVRGNTIKYLLLPKEVINRVPDEVPEYKGRDSADVEDAGVDAGAEGAAAALAAADATGTTARAERTRARGAEGPTAEIAATEAWRPCARAVAG
eukprot:CAMPEP_0114631814 /NCGR_PEP_ID=MMETSP0168-20121206/14608_1 /TAXON_ID=95228 ORGANISM="Vannella sp., Strain DIVA3 517/6/12" /NCGR_SAMPLE_ID=MMETSP0168 /ASSEMBLY_ACC=CAM_ASM_000044 /LENGTH=152 /DNA_ID=CAMNT_0001843395 /DNA_START=54 /DNA_END=509 /DNA_ORIENTATION=+